QLRPAQRLAGDEPVETDPGVVAGRAVAVGAAGERDPHLADARDGRSVCGDLRAVLLEERLAVERHAVLDVDRAAERGDALQGFRPQRLAVVESPAQILERNLAVHL